MLVARKNACTKKRTRNDRALRETHARARQWLNSGDGAGYAYHTLASIWFARATILFSSDHSTVRFIDGVTRVGSQTQPKAERETREFVPHNSRVLSSLASIEFDSSFASAALDQRAAVRPLSTGSLRGNIIITTMKHSIDEPEPSTAATVHQFTTPTYHKHTIEILYT